MIALSIGLSINTSAAVIDESEIYSKEDYLSQVPDVALTDEEKIEGIEDGRRLFELLINTVFSSAKDAVKELPHLMIILIFGAICQGFANTNGFSVNSSATVSINFIIFICIFKIVAEIYSRSITVIDQLSSYTLTLSSVMVSFLTFDGSLNSAGVLGTFTITLGTFLSFLSLTVLPIVCAFITLSAVSGVSGKSMGSLSGMVSGMYMTVFGGSLSLLSLVVSFQNKSAAVRDSVLRRGVKIASAYAIPVVGGALSESFDNISLGFATIKNSFGLGAALIIILSLLPCIVSVIVYRMLFIVVASVCEIADCSGISSVLRAFDGFFNVILITLVLNAVAYLYSLYVFCEAGTI